MTQRLFAAVVIIVLGTAGAVHAEFIGVFKDTNGCPCEITDRGAPGLLSVVVLHVDSPGATGSRFMAPKPYCAAWTYLGETSPFPKIGGSQSGASIGYGPCRTGTFLLLTINYFVQGLTPECCYYPVEPDPVSTSGMIEIVDCNYQLRTGYQYGGEDIINSNVSCQCAPGPVSCYPVPVKQSTWGGIKKLYR